jgi:hypothetical protein
MFEECKCEDMVLEIEQKVERKHIEFIIDTLEVW